MLQKFKKILLWVFFLSIIAISAVGALVSWPFWFPKFKPGTCVEDDQTHRVYRVLTVQFDV